MRPYLPTSPRLSASPHLPYRARLPPQKFKDPVRLMECMGLDISSAMVEYLGFFQSFDDVKVYYDNGQHIAKQGSE